MRYYVIFAALPEGHRVGQNVFASAITRDGRRVCAQAAVDEFPELFYGQTLMLVELTCADFPPPPASACI